MDRPHKSFPLDCVTIPNSYYFRAGVSLNVSEDGNTVYAFGGYEDGGNTLYALQNVESMGHDFWEESWNEQRTKSIGRCAHTTFIKDNKLHVHGGYGCGNSSKTGFTAYSLMEVIDLSTLHTSVLKYNTVIANVERRWHQSFVVDDKFFIYGGWNDAGPPGLDDMISLDLNTLHWSTVPFNGDHQPTARRWHSLLSIDHSHNYLLFGGYNGDKKHLLSDLHTFDLERATWTKLEASRGAPGPRAKHNLVQLSSKEVLLIGGQDNRGDNCQDMHIFHTDDLSWSLVRNSKEFFAGSRAHSKVVRVHSTGLVVGGGSIASYLSPFYYLDTRLLQI